MTMPADGAGTASGDAGTQAGTDPAGTAGTAAGTAAAGTQPPDNRDPAEILADAAAGTTAADPAAQLAAAQADVKRWRDLSRQNEGRAKANAEAAAELQRIKDAEKTELQLATERQADAERRASEATALYHRTLAAATYGLPPSLMGAISGSTEDEITASAEQVAAGFNQAVADAVAAQLPAAVQAAVAAQAPAGRQPGAARPVESMRAGALPSGANAPASIDDWIRQAAGR